jgi:hypothetical protein
LLKPLKRSTTAISSTIAAALCWDAPDGRREAALDPADLPEIKRCTPPPDAGGFSVTSMRPFGAAVEPALLDVFAGEATAPSLSHAMTSARFGRTGQAMTRECATRSNPGRAFLVVVYVAIATAIVWVPVTFLIVFGDRAIALMTHAQDEVIRRQPHVTVHALQLLAALFALDALEVLLTQIL